MKVLVIGDLMIDNYLIGNTDRISPEAPVVILDVKNEKKLLGGAGNVINNLRAFCLDVEVLSVIGDDEVSKELTTLLDNLDVKHYLIKEKNRLTTKKTRLVSSHQQMIRYDLESKQDILEETKEKLLNIFKQKIDEVDIVLLSDYNKGVLTFNLTQEIIKNSNKPVLIDPKGNNYLKYKGATLITPNKKEAKEATGLDVTKDNLKEILTIFKNKFNIKIPLVTLSEDGIAYLDNDKVVIKPTKAKEVYDVTGAGDTVLASLAYMYFSGIEKAVEFANLAAGVVVGKLGSATATLEEIEEYKSSLHLINPSNRIKTFKEIEKIRKKLQNKKIVFTNGCFDILHIGHVSYLNKAKSFGDILIVGLNSNNSVKRLKGSTRPINDEYDRAYILASLESVDYVVIFDEDTPYELIKIIQPDILVKGADYKGKEVVGSDIAKETKLVEFIDGKSTTKIIEKIKN